MIKRPPAFEDKRDDDRCRTAEENLRKALNAVRESREALRKQAEEMFPPKDER